MSSRVPSSLYHFTSVPSTIKSAMVGVSFSQNTKDETEAVGGGVTTTITSTGSENPCPVQLSMVASTRYWVDSVRGPVSNIEDDAFSIDTHCPPVETFEYCHKNS